MASPASDAGPPGHRSAPCTRLAALMHFTVPACYGLIHEASQRGPYSCLVTRLPNSAKSKSPTVYQAIYYRSSPRRTSGVDI